MSRGGRLRRVEPTTTSSGGLWTLNEIADYISETKWPRGPVAPTGLSITINNAQLALSWTAPATTHGTITNYLVEYTASGGSAQYVLTNSTSTLYALTGLTNGTSYTVRVAAVNFTAGDYSGTATGTPNQVNPLVVSPATIMNREGTVLTWSGQGIASNKITSGGSNTFAPDHLRSTSWLCNVSGTLYFDWGPGWVNHDGSHFAWPTQYKKNNNLSSSFATAVLTGDAFPPGGLYDGSRRKRGISVAANDVIIIWNTDGVSDAAGLLGLPLQAWIE